MLLIGYARVSTTGQDLETQKEILENEGCKKLFVEKVTGTSTKQRAQLYEAIEFAREGDTLVVTKIDRLARSIMDLNKIVHELAEKGVNVRFVKEDMKFDGSNEANSLQTLLFNILGSFAQFERDLIVERTTEGRERAKRQGKHMGRPGQDEKTIKRAIKLFHERKTNGMSVNDIVKTTGVPRSTLYAKIRE
ncbi:recombinase family protein [Peribacillus sp. TH16]|uniref:recombinase family protein n=1 Tax=Peribacillus sp. TH16 TaxID=2798482 RepID=UPI00191271AF|nr:recombinase family protein [Peribacillus sp. TH16]